MEKLELEDGEEVEAKKRRTRQVGAAAGRTDLDDSEEADGENGGAEEAGVRKRGGSELGAEAGGERLARAWSDSLGDSCGRASRTR